MRIRPVSIVEMVCVLGLLAGVAVLCAWGLYAMVEVVAG